MQGFLNNNVFCNIFLELDPPFFKKIAGGRGEGGGEVGCMLGDMMELQYENRFNKGFNFLQPSCELLRQKIDDLCKTTRKGIAILIKEKKKGKRVKFPLGFPVGFFNRNMESVKHPSFFFLGLGVSYAR